MVLVETQQCSNSLAAKRNERCLLEKFKASLNQKQPVRTQEEHKEYKRNWHSENRDRLCIEKKAKYQQHRDEIITTNKQHYQKNTDELRTMRNGKCSCECGDIKTYANKRRHERSNKHQEFLKSLEQD